MSEKIYIFDEIVVHEAHAPSLRDAYLQRYVPAAQARGMLLEGAWRSPPVMLDERLSTLHFLWSVADVAAWWRMRLAAGRVNPELDAAGNGDADKADWWRYVDSIAMSRKRTFMVDVGTEKTTV